MGWNVSSRVVLVRFLRLLSGSLVSAVQSRHHLASWNATKQGVEGLGGSYVAGGMGYG